MNATNRESGMWVSAILMLACAFLIFIHPASSLLAPSAYWTAEVLLGVIWYIFYSSR